MPRVNLAADIYKDKDLAELIRRYKYGKGLTNAQLAKQVGICGRTLAKYLAAPGAAPLKVLRKIQKKLQIPKEEMAVFLL